jgi:hypothetical protein
MPCLLAKHNFHKIVLVGFNIYRVDMPYEISSIRKGVKNTRYVDMMNN